MSTNNDNLGRIANALERIAAALEGGATPRPAQQTGTASTGGQRSNTSGGPTLPNYGRAKGQPIASASIDDLHWYGERCAQSIDDPSKARWRDQEMERLAAINAELKRRGQTPIGGERRADDDLGPPPRYRDDSAPSDEDIPF